jgi:hypothetical protein
MKTRLFKPSPTVAGTAMVDPAFKPSPETPIESPKLQLGPPTLKEEEWKSPPGVLEFRDRTRVALAHVQAYRPSVLQIEFRLTTGTLLTCFDSTEACAAMVAKLDAFFGKL